MKSRQIISICCATTAIALLMAFFQNCGSSGFGVQAALSSASAVRGPAPPTVPGATATPSPESPAPPAVISLVDDWLTVPGFHSYYYSGKILSEMASTGVNIYSFDTNLFGDDIGFSTSTGQPDGTWDFSDLKNKIDMALQADRTAKFFIRPYAGAPTWWKNANPSELEVYQDGCAYVGTTKNSAGTCVGSLGETPTDADHPRHVSFASVAMMAQWKSGIAALKKALVKWGYDGKVIGLTITGGSSQEWISWDANFTNSQSVRPMLYSAAQRGAYIAWLLNQGVAGDLPTEADFTNANFFSSGSSAFFDLSTARNVTSYYLFRSVLTVQIITALAHELKLQFPGIKVGAIYGYMNEMGGDPSYGHNALGKLLASPDIDFINPMSSYQDRAGKGADFERQPITSLAVHGKWILNDMDQQTMTGASNQAALCASYRLSSNPILQQVYKVNCDSGDPSSLYAYTYALAGFPVTAAGVVQPSTSFLDTLHLRRFLGYSIARDIRFTYLSLWNNPSPLDQEKSDLSDPNLLQNVLPQLNQAKKASFAHDRGSVAQVLVVSDEDSNAYIRNWQPQPYFPDQSQNVAGVGYHALATVRISLNKMGLPYDHVLLSDLATMDLSAYKLVIFLNAWSLNSAQRTMLQARIENNGRVVLWNYAAGLIKDGAKALQNTSDLIGFNLVNAARITAPAVQVDPSVFPLFSKAFTTGTKSVVDCCDTFYAADPNASVLGAYPGTAMTSMAIRIFSTWKSIWTANVTLPPTALRDLAKYAGAQVYNDVDEPFYLNHSYFTLVASSAGSRTVHFPRSVTITDAVSSTLAATAVTDFTFAVADGGVYIFRYD